MRLQRGDEALSCGAGTTTPTVTFRSAKARRRARIVRRSLGLSLLALAVSAPAAACTTPAYGVDLGADGRRAHVGGWLDQDEGGDRPTFAITVDGEEVHLGKADGEERRPWWPGSRRERRFDHWFSLDPGTHEVCVVIGNLDLSRRHGRKGDHGTKPGAAAKVSAAGKESTEGRKRFEHTTATTPDGKLEKRWCKTVTVPARPGKPGGTTPTTDGPSPTAPPPTAPPTTEPPAPPTTEAPAPPTTEPPAPAPTWQAEMLAAVNQARAQNGKPPVVACGSLDRSAQGYADVLATQNWFDHTGPDGSTLTSRTNASGYVGQALGENIAAGYPDVPTVMRGWLDSPGHRANILGDYEHLGVGRTDLSWVQNFGSGGTC